MWRHRAAASPVIVSNSPAHSLICQYQHSQCYCFAPAGSCHWRRCAARTERSLVNGPTNRDAALGKPDRALRVAQMRTACA